MDFAFVLIQVLNGLQYGLLLFLVAGGLTLILGIMSVINLAHGSLYMLGAYLALALTKQTGDFLLALALGIPVGLVFGLLLERILFRHIYARDHLHQVLMTYGLILIFEELRSMVWGDDVHALAVPAFLDFSLPLTDTLSYPAYRLAMSGACLVMAAGIWWLIARTRLGMMIRAGSHDREMVQALGIDIRAVYLVVFALGVALALLAGMLAAPVSSVFPNMGAQVLILCFVVVIIGGLGSVWGALLAALLIGLVDTFGKVLLPQASGALVYALMAVVLLWRPEGLFRRA